VEDRQTFNLRAGSSILPAPTRNDRPEQVVRIRHSGPAPATTTGSLWSAGCLRHRCGTTTPLLPTCAGPVTTERNRGPPVPSA
jgi:hypothetical protein